MNRLPEDRLRRLLDGRALLYSGSRAVRADLVNRTTLAAAQLDSERGADLLEELFLLMHRIAEEDERACEVA